MTALPLSVGATPYDPLRLAVRQSAEIKQRFAASPHASGVARDTLKLLAWIELGEETMLRAEDDCLVEYSQENHALLHQLYEAWLALCRKLIVTAESNNQGATQPDAIANIELSELRKSEERVAQWLDVQAKIKQYTLPQSELSAIAQRANISPGARGALPPSDG